MEEDSTREADSKAQQRKMIFLLFAGIVVAVVALYWGWLLLGWYIYPETATDRKDHVQVMAVGLGAIGAIVTAVIGWRNLRQNQRSTERTLAHSREIEENKAQNDTLQKYLELMGELLTKEGLRSCEGETDARILARSQTLTALQALGSNRKRILLEFLHESKLINKEKPVVRLVGTNLSKTNLRGINLSEANLLGANLSEVNLPEANLSGTNLSEADLRYVNLRNANLNEANLVGAKLFKAILYGAKLKRADLSKSNLLYARIGHADLSMCNLNEADLRAANLYWTDLRDANLKGADLRGATLQTLHNFTQVQLESAKGGKNTKIPYGLAHPDSWNENY